MFKEIGNKTAVNVEGHLIDGKYILITNMQEILRIWNKSYRHNNPNQLEFNYQGGCPTCDD